MQQDRRQGPRRAPRVHEAVGFRLSEGRLGKPEGHAQGPRPRPRAVLVANAVTFDLIGINKAIRNIGSEDDAEARRWFDAVDDIGTSGGRAEGPAAATPG